MKIDLSGTWQLTYRDMKTGEPWGQTIAATVPGDVHLDLMAVGLIAEPLVSDNNTKCRWTEDKEWVYTRTFSAEAAMTGKKLELVCEGLDLTADLWLNDQKVGSSNNMFIPHRFDVSGLLRVGENTIMIRIDPGFAAVEGKDLESYSHSWNVFDLRRPWMRKAQQSFFWDVAPRMVTCGIWKGISIEGHEIAVIRDLSVRSTIVQGAAVMRNPAACEEAADCGMSAEVSAEVTVVTELEVFSENPVEMELSGLLQGHGTELRWIKRVMLDKGLHVISEYLLMQDPKLWWPSGMGEANLYQVDVELREVQGAGHVEGIADRIGIEDSKGSTGGKGIAGNKGVTDSKESGSILDTRSLKHGIRSVQILQESLNDTEKTFTFVINGSKVFCKGGNWVPTDSIYARCSDAKIIRLLELAKDANFNMMRIWGGGIYETDAFYETCDRLGIMVWQDFMFACGYYPDRDPAFCAEAEQEIISVVKRLRKHSSLVVWSGNNENQVMFNCDGRPDKVFHGEKIFNEMMTDICGRLDPDRPYRRGSPYPGNSLEGDQHEWDYTLGWRDKNPKALRFWDYPEKNHKFLSEFGIFAPSALSSIKKFMGDAPVIKDSAIWNHHTNFFAHNGHIDGIIAMYYRDTGCPTLEEYILAGQMVQAEAMKYILEEFRSRMYTCSGTLFWEYNDTWGHIGYSLVDYYLARKALYFYMKRAFAHLHVVFREEGAKIMVVNDTLSDFPVRVESGLMTLHGEVLHSEFSERLILASSKMEFADLTQAISEVADKSTVFAFSRVWQEDKLVDSNRCFLVPIKEVRTPTDTLKWKLVKESPFTWRVSFDTADYAWMVNLTLPDGCEPSDNDFDIWPGQSHEVVIVTEEDCDRLDMRIESINQYNSKE